ncbi:Nicotinamide riboside transporter PnuC [Corynebacterium ciconiae DSM 44920]|uniref:nicotinamide riboside transporter PnuC n=1 Tax=Corynebacterium ciconiae TaxID=227319 RepID=UPI000374AF76|nr:nicotinamide riboside transporter PnuC [Corynebacterium ciconiae]WKD61623.1 Nicotinamide riboside transporter PnuC [Corynebacterium ciconiae DSM 44920]
MNPIVELLDATVVIGGAPILWREIIGNAFGIGSAIFGLKRRVWAWPVGIIGNILLFTVFLGGVFHTPQNLDLYGQAARQVMFLVVSLYGWYGWQRNLSTRDRSTDEAAVEPHWATPRQRLAIITFMVISTVICAQVFSALGSWGPWADAWIFSGSLLATFGMAKGWIEFWLLWLSVDLVGVPLLLAAGYYPSAVLYLVYGGFVAWGFVEWSRVERRRRSQPHSSTTPAEPVHAPA